MFNKYRSIENSYRENFIKQIKIQGFGDSEYIVQEKAHGANLSYLTNDGINFITAKRNGLLEQNESFYNYEIILEQLKPKFTNIWRQLKIKYPSVEQLTIFGEIIGGNYPHKEVIVEQNSFKIKKGIFYSPKNEFYAFDILINGDRYLDVDEANFYFAQENLLYAKTLFQGNLADCLNYSNSFESTIPLLLDLPEITPNTCEGTIIRPIKTSYLLNGNRIIIKNKNEKWSENKKYHKTIKKQEPLPEKVAKLQEAILTYVTENRLENVLSKLGEVTKEDFGQILGLFNKDVVDDFSKDYEDAIEGLDKKDFKSLRKSIAKATSNMIIEKLFS